MSCSRIRPPSIKCAPRLEPATEHGHNRKSESAKPDKRIVALVKLLARLAAEEDFRG